MCDITKTPPLSTVNNCYFANSDVSISSSGKDDNVVLEYSVADSHVLIKYVRPEAFHAYYRITCSFFKAVRPFVIYSCPKLTLSISVISGQK